MTNGHTSRHHSRLGRVGGRSARLRAEHIAGSNVIALTELPCGLPRRPEPKAELAAVLRQMIEAAALIREAEPEQARQLVLDAADDLLAYARGL